MEYSLVLELSIQNLQVPVGSPEVQLSLGSDYHLRSGLDWFDGLICDLSIV